MSRGVKERKIHLQSPNKTYSAKEEEKPHHSAHHRERRHSAADSDLQPGQKAIEALRNWNPSVRGGTPVSHHTLSGGDMPPVRGQHVWCILVACIGSCAAGTTLGYASGAMPHIEREPWYGLQRTPPENHWFADFLLLAAVPGALTGGFLTEIAGSRKVLLLSAFGLVGSWLSLLFSHNTTALFSARLMAGVFLGSVSSCVGVLVAEICPSNERTFFLGLVEVTRGGGMLYSYVLACFVSWEVQAGLCMVPAVLVMCLQDCVPDSPVWLMRRGNRQKAMAVMGRLYGIDVPVEFRLRTAADVAKSSATVATCARCLALALLLQLLPELTCARLFLLRGVQVVESMSTAVSDPVQVATLLVAGHVGLSALFAFLTSLGGRRHLLFLSAAITAVCMFLLRPVRHLVHSSWINNARREGTNWNGVNAVVLLVASHCLGMGHVPAMLATEILPARVRCMGAAGCWAARWLLAFAVSYKDSWLSELETKSYALAPGLLLALGAAVAAGLSPETEGHWLLAIEAGRLPGGAPL
ncbi:uncharacterized protein LOC144179859 [Haemaphysalis longicornis]